LSAPGAQSTPKRTEKTPIELHLMGISKTITLGNWSADILVRSRISVNPEADRNGQCRQDLTQCLSDILCEAIAARNDGKTSGSAIPKGLCPPARRADSRKRSRRRQPALISVNSRKCADCRQRLQILNPPWDHYPWRSSVLTVSYSQPTIGQVMNISS